MWCSEVEQKGFSSYMTLLTPRLHVPQSSGKSDVLQLPATQHLPKVLRPSVVSTEEFRHDEGARESQFMSPPEHGVKCQSQPMPSESWTGKGSHTMPIGSPDTVGVAVSFDENLPSSGLPGSASHGVSGTAHSSDLVTPISVSLTVPASVDS